MKRITQDILFKEAVIKYSVKYGVTKAAIRYKKTRQWIYYWLRRYTGDIESLKERSRRPRYHPNQHTKEELKMIEDMRRRNPDTGLTMFWIKLRDRGYERAVASLYRAMKRDGYFIGEKTRKKEKYKPKPYEKMQPPVASNSLLSHLPLLISPEPARLTPFMFFSLFNLINRCLNNYIFLLAKVRILFQPCFLFFYKSFFIALLPPT